MDADREPNGQFDDGLVLEGAPAQFGRPTWLVLLLFVAIAFGLGTGTGFGIGQAPTALPTASAALTAAPRKTTVAAEEPAAAVATPSPDAEGRAWLEDWLPNAVSGFAAAKESGSFPEDERRTMAEALAAACSVDLGSMSWAEASWPDLLFGWSSTQVSVFFVPAECPSDVRLDASIGTREWEPIQIGDKTVRQLLGANTWLYARQQMLYVIRDAEPPVLAEILAILP